MNNLLKFGPPRMEGEIWDEKGLTDIVEIMVSHQEDCINSLRFTYQTDGKGLIFQSHGEPDGLKLDIVGFESPKHVLTSISGKYKDGRLASITFSTLCGFFEKKYGPFGSTGSRSSSSSYEDFESKFSAYCFGGFHGSVYDGCVHAIGVYVKPYYW
ncbi:hypothetical protein R6Q59_003199 [Mikania micrantha]